MEKAGQARKGSWDKRTVLLIDISTAHLARLLGQDGLGDWLDDVTFDWDDTCRSQASPSASVISMVSCSKESVGTDQTSTQSNCHNWSQCSVRSGFHRLGNKQSNGTTRFLASVTGSPRLPSSP